MSKTDARKMTIIEELLSGRFTNTQAANLLDLSVRQVQRLKSEAAANGIHSVLHKNRGRKPVNTLNPQAAKAIIQIYNAELSGYNFCHTTDVLAEEKGIFVSVSTVSRLLTAHGIRSPKAKRRPKRHRSRDARAREGEMAQMDASKFDWLSNGSYLHLHGAIDDATGRILALHFEKEETFEGYSEVLFQMNRDSHLPREIYTDARTVFVYDSKVKKKLTLEQELAGESERHPQFARALKELNILLIIARSAQAKGGIERLWGTLQDRLPKDLQRHKISSVEDANAFLKCYIPYYNRKFAAQAANSEKVYLPSYDEAALELILTKQETRKLDSGLSFSFRGQKYRLPAYVDKQPLLAAPHDTLKVATSHRIGLKVLFKGYVFAPLPLQKQMKESQTPHTPAPPPSPMPHQTPKNRSPWHKSNNFLFPTKHLKESVVTGSASTPG